jgi:hypothetical protein
MTDQNTVLDRELMRRWVETWRRAGQELDEIRRRQPLPPSGPPMLE